MKIFRLSAVFLLCALLVSGCAAESQPGLTEDDVKAAYLSAEEVYNWFDLSSLPTSGEAAEVDGVSYRPVNYAGLNTYADLKAKVNSLFAPSVANALLAEGTNYRDIGGRLYTTDAARGSNLYLKERTFSVSRTDDAHWTVTVTFWADSWEWEQPSVTIGYSQAVLHYERTDSGWRFTDFCSSDALDTDADTVFTFTYDDASFEASDFGSASDLQLALYLIHADGAYYEGTSDMLYQRFAKDPGAIVTLLAKLHPDWQDALTSLLVGDAAVWYPDEDFTGLLDGLSPAGDAEQSVTDTLRAKYQAAKSAETAAAVTPEQEFSLGPLTQNSMTFPGNQPLFSMLQLGLQNGTYPWGYEALTGTPETVEGCDYGQGYRVVSGNLTLQYMDDENGLQYLTSMTTADASPATALRTPRDIRCGDAEAVLKERYAGELSWLDRDHVPAPASAADYDGAWIYEPGGEAGCMHIAFYMKDGAVAVLEVLNLIDGRLLPEG